MWELYGSLFGLCKYMCSLYGFNLSMWCLYIYSLGVSVWCSVSVFMWSLCQWSQGCQTHQYTVSGPNNHEPTRRNGNMID